MIIIVKFFNNITVLGVAHNTILVIIIYSLIYKIETINFFEILSSMIGCTDTYNVKFNINSLEILSNLISTSSSFELKSFRLNLNNFNVVQSFYPINYLDFFKLDVFDSTLLITYFLFLFIFFTFLYKA